MSDPVSVSLYEAKTHLSELGERAAGGEEIIVTKHGKPRFRIAPIGVQKAPRTMGVNRMGITYIADDFDEPDEGLERLFGARE